MKTRAWKPCPNSQSSASICPFPSGDEIFPESLEEGERLHLAPSLQMGRRKKYKTCSRFQGFYQELVLLLHRL
ncbi:hypothetical protein AAHA92_30549 [Salvia divinorum]|uniref:Uncharacterized protein n=1 Tax=Salvia divinorum TaxID=28513 RepID=A0ABD1FRA8_SALDI